MKERATPEIQVTRFGNMEECFTAVNKGMLIPPERHGHFETVITLKNNYIHTVNGVSCRPEVGDIVILRPQDCHSARPIDDTSEHICRDVYIDQKLFKEACDYISPTLFVKIMTAKEPPFFHLDEKELKTFEENIVFSYPNALAEDYEIYRAVKRVVVCGVIGAYIKKSYTGEKELPPCLIKLLAKLQYDESFEKSIAETARDVGYSPDYLCRLFKERFGKSIESYIIERRVYDSLTLLLQTDMPVHEIAAKMGWKCTGNYINHFKTVFKSTPAKYRREFRSRVNRKGCPYG